VSVITFTVLGVAAPQGSFRAFVSKSTGRAFMQQSCKRTMPWRQEVAACAEKALKDDHCDGWPTSMSVSMHVDFYLPRPASHLGKKGLRPSAPEFPSKKPDLSKLVRAAEDALTGIIYDDDARIVRLQAAKYYAAAGTPPRAEFALLPGDARHDR
jgi:Holliday junction resolvase RusA-like endonuclease